MDEIGNPHDIFFKEIFSRLDVAKDLVRHYLPENIVSLLDLETMALTKDSFIDPVFKEHFSDLLFTTQLKNHGELKIYLLVEHKSYPELMIAYQLYRYISRIWEREQKEQVAIPLPPILPIVIYHGEREWRISTHFSALLLDIEALKPYQPQFQYILIDLNRFGQDEIVGEPLLQTALILMKYIHSPELETHAGEIFEHFADRFEERHGEITRFTDFFDNLIRPMLLYIINGTDKIRYNDMLEEINQTLKKRGSHAMPTIADRLREEGIVKGIAISIIKILESRFGSVPYEIQQELESITNEGELLSLHQVVLNTSSMEEFTRHLHSR